MGRGARPGRHVARLRGRAGRPRDPRHRRAQPRRRSPRRRRWPARLVGRRMRFLLTSSGIRNTSIHDALVDLLGKPIAESSALAIPTGVQPFPDGPSHVYGFITGTRGGPMCGLGWKSLGVLELTALPSIKEKHWVPAGEEIGRAHV